MIDKILPRWNKHRKVILYVIASLIVLFAVSKIINYVSDRKSERYKKDITNLNKTIDSLVVERKYINDSIVYYRDISNRLILEADSLRMKADSLRNISDGMIEDRGRSMKEIEKLKKEITKIKKKYSDDELLEYLRNRK